MRFASYLNATGAPTWGVELDGRLLDLGPSGAGIAASLREAILSDELPTRGDFEDAPAIAVESATFLPVIADPRKIICVGVNYNEHRAETKRAEVSAPTIFTRFADTQIGHNAPAVRPASSTQFDYEGELAVVIGKPAHLVTEADAMSVIAGYSIYNDFTARDWQRATSQWIPGKNFSDTGAFGPYLVPVADVPDVTALHLETRVNGQVRQSASVADLIFTIPEIIAHVTGFTALAPGDVIVTGTPGGVGMFMDPQGLLVGGDLVEVEITGLGILSNPVKQG